MNASAKADGLRQLSGVINSSSRQPDWKGFGDAINEAIRAARTKGSSGVEIPDSLFLKHDLQPAFDYHNDVAEVLRGKGYTAEARSAAVYIKL